MSSIGTCGCDSNAENVLFQTSAYASFFNSDGIEEEQRKKMNFESGEPLLTHFTSRFTGTLDYIFYTGILEQQIFLTFIMHQIFFFGKYNLSHSNRPMFFLTYFFYASKIHSESLKV